MLNNLYVLLKGIWDAYAFIIALSTGSVLAFGINKVIEDSIIGSHLELIGKYSYSIYLVHIPVIQKTNRMDIFSGWKKQLVRDICQQVRGLSFQKLIYNENLKH